jgi:hypothetical protein
MAGRAGRPQFDKEGVAIALAPEELVQELRKEIKDLQKRGRNVDEEKIRKGLYSRARADAKKRDDVVYDRDAHRALIEGEPAELRSRTRITAEQILAVGLPDLQEEPDPSLPVYMNLNISTVVDNLLLSDREKDECRKLLTQVTDNLHAAGVIDEHGAQISGEMIRELQGIDGLFIRHALLNHQLDHEQCVALVEFLVDHNVIQRVLDKKLLEKRREWIKNRLRERRQDNPQVSWEDVEEEYDEKFPRELSQPEIWHQEFASGLPHPELHGGKTQKNVWASIEEEEATFMSFVDTHRLAHEEGSLFSYLARVMKTADKLHEATGVGGFAVVGERVRKFLSVIDARLVKML